MSASGVVAPEGVPTIDHPEVGWLWRITDPTRELCARPWTIERDGEMWTFATNGRVFAMRRGVFGFDHHEPESFRLLWRSMPNVGAKTFPLDAVRAVATPPAPPTDPRPDCDECSNTGRIDCDECEGVGEVDCECISCGDAHETSCDECDGDGWTPCEACGREPAKNPPMVVCTVDGVPFNVALLGSVVPFLPDAPALWQQGHPDRAAVLTVGEWTTGFMPLRHDPDLKIAHTFDLELLSSSRPEGRASSEETT